MRESWRAVKGYAGLYAVSDLGRVKSRSGVLKPGKNSSGYMLVGLSSKGVRTSFSVHVLVLEAFCGPRPAAHDSCHDNNDRTDNRLINLRWDTRKNNHADKRRHGTHQAGAKGARAILTDEQVTEIRTCIWERGKGRFFARKFGVTEAAISRIHLGKNWKQKLVGIAA